jgi:hypothetical protein
MLIIYEAWLLRLVLRHLPVEYEFDSITRQHMCIQSAHAWPERKNVKKQKAIKRQCENTKMRKSENTTRQKSQNETMRKSEKIWNANRRQILRVVKSPFFCRVAWMPPKSGTVKNRRLSEARKRKHGMALISHHNVGAAFLCVFVWLVTVNSF